MNPIITNRLRLRKPQTQDAQFYSEIENDSEVKKYIRGPTGKSKEQYRNSIEALPPDYRCLTIELLHSNTPIGRCGLITTELESEIQIVLAKPYWRQGLGLEAGLALLELSAETFPDKKIVAKVHPQNAGSISILQKIGMVCTGSVSSPEYDDGFLRFEKAAKAEAFLSE